MENNLEPQKQPNNPASASANNEIQNTFKLLLDQMKKGVVGNEQEIELLYISLLCNGHVLLEGVPGIAKTLMCKLLAKCVDIDFQRVQFTPDLMPSDILGTSIFDMKKSEFTFKKGPIFSNIVLIDEINRAPAKTQAALFETMEEFQVTMDGTTYDLSAPFCVIATQNPIDHEGTYKLPEAQLDRFLFKLNLDYPSIDNEFNILKKYQSDFEKSSIENIKPILTASKLLEFRKKVEQVYISEEQLKYVAEMVNGTRSNGDLFLGASPRASLAILKTSKASAAIAGRDFVTPDDIRKVSYHVLSHRIILTPEREMEGKSTKDVIKEIIDAVEVPR